MRKKAATGKMRVMIGLQESDPVRIFLRTLVAGTILFCGCAGYPPKEVVIIEKTHSYHRPECTKVMMAKTQYVLLTADISKTYKQCPYCKPDTL
jgi:hypothetical protein